MPRIRAESIAVHKAQTRAELLDAAAVLFRAQGYAETSLGDIAGYVGVGRTTMYEYFADKEDVLACLVEDRLPEVIDGLLAGVPDDVEPRERLAELVVRALDFITDEEDLGVLLMRETPRLSVETQRRIRATHRQLETEIVNLCAAGIDHGSFRNYEADEAGRLVFAVMWSASQALLRDADAKQRRHEVTETVVRFVFDGLSGSHERR
jgi:AcrR family transcriptional regulator